MVLWEKDVCLHSLPLLACWGFMIIGNLLKQTSNILYSLMKSTLLAHIDSYMYESGSNLHLQYFCVSL